MSGCAKPEIPQPPPGGEEDGKDLATAEPCFRAKERGHHRVQDPVGENHLRRAGRRRGNTVEDQLAAGKQEEQDRRRPVAPGPWPGKAGSRADQPGDDIQGTDVGPVVPNNRNADRYRDPEDQPHGSDHDVVRGALRSEQPASDQDQRQQDHQPARPAGRLRHGGQVVAGRLDTRHRAAKNQQERDEHHRAGPDEKEIKRRRQVVTSAEGVERHEDHGEHDTECPYRFRRDFVVGGFAVC